MIVAFIEQLVAADALTGLATGGAVEFRIDGLAGESLIFSGSLLIAQFFPAEAYEDGGDE